MLGTSLQEGERIELQLRGRAGRQGDPGTTQLMFDVSDPLITNYGMQSEFTAWPCISVACVCMQCVRVGS